MQLTARSGDRASTEMGIKMNKARRATLKRLSNHLYSVQIEIEEARDEEQEAFDNLPESFQESERGAGMELAVDDLEEAIDCLQSARDCIDRAVE